jgi:hypothetical protein
MRNWLLGPARTIYLTISLILKVMRMLFTLHSSCLTFLGLGEFGLFHSDTRIRFVLIFPNACVIIARVSIAILPIFAHLMLFLCRICREIASGQIQIKNKMTQTISTSTQLSEMLCTDSQGVLVLAVPSLCPTIYIYIYIYCHVYHGCVW